MGAITWGGVTSWVAGFAATDLNALGNNWEKASTAGSGAGILDNTAGAYLYVQFEVSLAALSPGVGAMMVPFLIPLLSDGINYASGADGATVANMHPWVNYPHCAIALRTTGATAQAQQSPLVAVPHGKYMLALLNRSGVALAAAGNQVSWRMLAETVA